MKKTKISNSKETPAATALATVVPDGTPASEVGILVKRFAILKKTTALGLIQLGSVVYDAKTSLDGAKLKEFSDRVGLGKDSSTFRKMLEVGRKAERLTAIVEKLPPNWTTLYELATLQDDQFERAANIIAPTSTLRELQEAAGVPSVSSGAGGFEISLTFAQEPDKKSYYKALDSINEARKLLGATVRCPKNLEKKFKVTDVKIVREAA
jgi:hypothetical protein